MALIAGGATAAAIVGRRATRASLLSLAAGVIFGMTAAVTLSLTRLVRFGDATSVLAHWQPWVLLALGATGLLISASAYKAGPLRSSLPIMDTVEPISGVLIGTIVFGESLATSPLVLIVQLLAAAVAVAGIRDARTVSAHRPSCTARGSRSCDPAAARASSTAGSCPRAAAS